MALDDIEDRFLRYDMDLRDVSSALIDKELKALNQCGYFGPAPRADGQICVRFMNLSDEPMDVFLAGSSQPCNDWPLVPYVAYAPYIPPVSQNMPSTCRTNTLLLSIMTLTTCVVPGIRRELRPRIADTGSPMFCGVCWQYTYNVPHQRR